MMFMSMLTRNLPDQKYIKVNTIVTLAIIIIKWKNSLQKHIPYLTVEFKAGETDIQAGCISEILKLTKK